MEMKNMMQRIEAVLAKRNLGVNPKFTADYIVRHGFYKDAKPLAIETIEHILELCIYGVNNGFGKVKDSLRDLADIVVELTEIQDEADIKKIQKLQGQVKKIMKNKNKQEQSQPSAREEIVKTVQTTISAIDTLLGNVAIFGEQIVQQEEVLNEIKKKATALLVALEGVCDFSSKQACECACHIMVALMNVRSHLLNAFCTNSDLAEMDAAIESASKWAQMTEEVKPKDRAEKPFPHYKEDGVGQLSGAQQALNDFQRFCERLKQEESRLTDPTGKIGSRINEIEQQLADIRVELQGIFKEVENNGDNVTLQQRRAALATNIKRLQAEQEKLKAMLQAQQQSNKARLAILDIYKLEVLLPLQAEIDAHPANAGRLISQLDFGDIVAVLSGNYGRKNAESASMALIRVKNEALRVNNEAKEYLSQLQDISEDISERSMQDEELYDDVPEQKIHVQPDVISEGDDEMLKQFAMGGSQQPQSNQQNQQEQNSQNNTEDPYRLTDDDK